MRAAPPHDPEALRMLISSSPLPAVYGTLRLLQVGFDGTQRAGHVVLRGSRPVPLTYLHAAR